MDSAESENSKPANSQSVFSARSGIQDLLTRPAEQAPAGGAQPEEDDKETVPDALAKEQKGRHQKSKRQIERVKRRQKNYLHERRAQKRRQVMFSRVRLLFKFCFAISFSVLLWQIVQSPVWVYEKPLFQLRQNHLLQRKQIAPLVQGWVGKPIYAIDTGLLARDIQQQFSIARRVIVRRHVFPHQLEILIAEKTPWAEIYRDEKQTVPYALLIQDDVIDLGKYAYRSGLYDKRLIEKIMIPPRTRLSPPFLEQVRSIAWQARHVKGLHFEGVDARNPKRIVLRFRECPVILGAMNASASHRLDRLPALAPKVLELHKAIAAVDLRWEEQVTFHKKPNVELILSQEEVEEGH